MHIQIILNVKPVYPNAIIAKITTVIVLPVLAILHGIIVVWHLNATANQDRSAI